MNVFVCQASLDHTANRMLTNVPLKRTYAKTEEHASLLGTAISAYVRTISLDYRAILTLMSVRPARDVKMVELVKIQKAPINAFVHRAIRDERVLFTTIHVHWRPRRYVIMVVFAFLDTFTTLETKLIRTFVLVKEDFMETSVICSTS